MQENFDFIDLSESKGASYLKKSIGSFVGNIGIIVAALTLFCAGAVFFMDISLSSFVTVKFSISFLILLFCSYTIYFSLADTGTRCALSDKAYKKAKEEYENAKSELKKNGKLDYLNEFCHDYVKNELIATKKTALLGVGISYDEFCEKYQGKEKKALPDSLSKKEKRAIILAEKTKPITLTPDMLLSVGRGEKERRTFHKNPSRVRLTSTLQALIPTTITSFFAVSIVCSVIEEPTLAVVTECLIKLFTLIWNGSKGFLMGYNNIAVDTTNYLSDCTDILTLFSGYAENNCCQKNQDNCL